MLWFLVNDQLDAQFFCMYLFQFSTCFEQPRAHHQENQLYQYNIWYMSLYVGDRFVCRSESSFPTCTQSGHRHRVTYTRCCIDTIGSPDDEHEVCSKHVENWNKYIEKNCASSWSFSKKLYFLITSLWLQDHLYPPAASEQVAVCRHGAREHPCSQHRVLCPVWIPRQLEQSHRAVSSNLFLWIRFTKIADLGLRLKLGRVHFIR